MNTEKETPMMAQWRSCKEKAGSALLLFRMGDFYEAFHNDASIAAKTLNLTLTKRQNIPMSGIPVHAADNYIDKLVAAGITVAVAEQLEDPATTKGLVKRDITRILSAGTHINSSLIQEKENHFFISVAQVGKSYGLAIVDLSCALFQAAEFSSFKEFEQELFRIDAKELLMSDKFKGDHLELIEKLQESSLPLHFLSDLEFHPQVATEGLLEQFAVHTLDGFGLMGKMAATVAAGALISYLKDKHLFSLNALHSLSLYSPSDAMLIDPATVVHLELFSSKREESSLFYQIDKTMTAMGGRLLKVWLKRPLYDLSSIQARQDAVATMIKRSSKLIEIKNLLNEVGDIERLTVKISMGYATAKDLLALAYSLKALPPLKEAIDDLSKGSALLFTESMKINPLEKVQKELFDSLIDPPPAKLGEGSLIKQGVIPELDELKLIATNTKEFLADYLATLKSQTGIKTLKLGYTRMFGYYIEVSRGQAHMVPESFIRRQTLVNAERYITEELKAFETKVLTAEEKISTIEREFFQKLLEMITPYSQTLLSTANAIAVVDCLSSLALVAFEREWIRPVVNDSNKLDILGGRHPVIENLIGHGSFVPNDTYLNDADQRLYLITGPNMAGKSTYIRQVALIAILAQMGSFVPASKVEMGMIDKLFSRIGASDDLSRGQSTFMVEMAETANILHNATDRSLVILDEIGRGTSTYDGISIAWSVAEYLLTQEGKRAKTLFATHYFELTKLQELVLGAKNFHSAVQESDKGVHFLRKILPGGTDKSYGIHVAKLAGLPKPAVDRALEILDHLEEVANRKELFTPAKKERLSRKAVDLKSQLLLFN